MKDFFEELLELIKQQFGDHYYIYIIGSVLIILGVVMLISSGYKNKRKAIEQQINLSHNLFHFKLDLSKNEVYYFTESNMSNAKIITLDEFYKFYNEKNGAAIKQWLDDAVSKKRYKTFINFISYSRKYKQYLNNCLEIKKISEDLTKIYFDFIFIPLYNKNKPISPYIKEEYQLEKLFFKQNKKSSVLTGLISFHTIDEPELIDSYNLDKITLWQIINRIQTLCDNKHLITIREDGNISFIIFSYDHHKDTFLKDLERELNIFYEVKDRNYETFNVTYTITKMKDLHHKYYLTQLNDTSKTLILNAVYSKKVVSLKESQFTTNKEYILKDENVKLITKKKDYVIEFCPMFNIKNCHIMSYRLKIKPNNPVITTYKEFIDSLLSSKDIVSFYKYIIECSKSILNDEILEKRKIQKKIIIDISAKMFYELNKVIEDIKDLSDISFVFNFNSLDFYNHSDRYPKIFDDLEQFKKQAIPNIEFGFHLAHITHLDERLYEMIDLVSFSSDLFNQTRKDYHQNSLFNNIIRKIKQYAKQTPIYVSGVDDWVTYETLLSYNMKYCSGNIFEVENNVHEIVNKRITSRVKSIYKKHFLPSD